MELSFKKSALISPMLLPASVFSIDELGVAIAAGHKIGEKQQFFPAVEGATESAH